MAKTIKILTMNIGNPSLERAKKQIEWIKNRTEDIFILTETKNSVGCNYIADVFSGYNLDMFLSVDNMYVSFPKSLTNDHGVMCISKFPIKKNHTPFSIDSQYYGRYLETVLNINDKNLHAVGLYVPSRDQSPEKIARKKSFLEQTSMFLSEIKNPSTIICGDFNIVDKNHIPHYSVFKDWEYSFYENLISLGYVDAFKLCHPYDNQYSWVGRTNDGYRYDYCFVSNSLANRVVSCNFVHETRDLRLTDHSALHLELKC